MSGFNRQCQRCLHWFLEHQVREVHGRMMCRQCEQWFNTGADE